MAKSETSMKSAAQIMVAVQASLLGNFPGREVTQYFELHSLGAS